MPLPWVRLDTSFPRNPKLLAMLAEKEGHRAALVYLCMLAYCGEHGTDGFVTREALPFCHARHADATLLVTYKFLYPQAGGWLIHDWDTFQESSDETKQRRIRAQAAAAARWAGHEPMTNAQRSRRWRERQAQQRNGSCDDADSNAT